MPLRDEILQCSAPDGRSIRCRVRLFLPVAQPGRASIYVVLYGGGERNDWTSDVENLGAAISRHFCVPLTRTMFIEQTHFGEFQLRQFVTFSDDASLHSGGPTSVGREAVESLIGEQLTTDHSGRKLSRVTTGDGGISDMVRAMSEMALEAHGADATGRQQSVGADHLSAAASMRPATEGQTFNDEQLAVMRAHMDKVRRMFDFAPPTPKTKAAKLLDTLLYAYCWVFAAIFRPSLLREQPPSAPGGKSIARQGNP